MARARNIPARPVLLTMAVLALWLFAAGCNLPEPRRPMFLPTPLPASPTPVYPLEPIDLGVNDRACEILAEGLSKAPRSNLRYNTDVTFRKSMTDLETARDLMDASNDRLLRSLLDAIFFSIERDDTETAKAATDALVGRCKELGYLKYMAPFGFKVW